MLKFKGLILTIALSFFALFLFETNGNAVALNKVSTAKHDIKLERSYNALAISPNNGLHDLISIDKKKDQTTENTFFNKKTENYTVLENDLQYLKVCDNFDVNLTTRTIIYPFHSFL
ncbi:hypothetical protein [Mariniflexile sp.]|uniref:hypothetical protein n=1 Tax=Mariniflexile sp. TaxID=1979402 RepID=UPI003561516B